jgi:hypothetical protein
MLVFPWSSTTWKICERPTTALSPNWPPLSGKLRKSGEKSGKSRTTLAPNHPQSLKPRLRTQKIPPMLIKKFFLRMALKIEIFAIAFAFILGLRLDVVFFKKKLKFFEIFEKFRKIISYLNAIYWNNTWQF